jgi:hypothetical protein
MPRADNFDFAKNPAAGLSSIAHYGWQESGQPASRNSELRLVPMTGAACVGIVGSTRKAAVTV